jgi:mannose-6-phosphate isomerase-like protein (cupin superfamily)
VISGSGGVRHKDGTTPIEAGDAFIFKPGEPHQITNDTAEDMILYVVADTRSSGLAVADLVSP